jgi:DNA-binding LacI/PurR family transcriptional regulator
MMRPTLRNIAEICKVSTATVSMVLAGKGSISAEMSSLIKRTAEELGYKRNEARKDRGPSFKYVCIIQWEEAPYLWHFSQPFVLELERLLVSEGFRPLVIHKLPELNDLALYNEIKTARAGVVFSVHYVNLTLFDQLEENGVPVILVNNSNFQDRYWSVLTDDIQGAYDGTRHLLDLGHRRIGYGEYKRSDITSVVRDRYFGFKRALDEENIPFPEERYISVDLSAPDALIHLSNKLRDLIIDTPDPITALFLHDDYFGAIVHKALLDLGLRIPEDVSLLCPGDVMDYREPFFPRLTTMQIDRPLMISISWELLLNRLITETSNPKVIKTKMQLIDRGSCAAPKEGGNYTSEVHQI